MTVREIAVLVGQMDPKAKHYETASDGANYTKWQEYEYIGQPADDEYGDGWKFQIDRYTKEEYDELMKKLIAESDVPEGIEPFPAVCCKWVFDEIHKANGLGIFCHPRWISNMARCSFSFDAT